jgi:hypothetical protein
MQEAVVVGEDVVAAATTAKDETLSWSWLSRKNDPG